MLRFKNRKYRFLAMLSLLVLLVAGCSFGGDQQPPDPAENLPDSGEEPEVDPTSLEWDEEVQFDEDGNEGESPENSQESGSETQTNQATKLTLYFMDKNGYVVPIAMDVPRVEGIAQQALSFMTKGGPGEELLPEGFSALIPPDTQATAKREGNLLSIDFSPEFTQVEAGQEQKVVEAITYTMTEFPEVEEVEITVSGYPLTELGENYPVSQPLTRESLGINLEFSDDAQPGRTTPVTLYFEGVNGAGDSYLVPVTRLIPLVSGEEQIAQEALAELIQGPDPSSQLVSPLVSELKVLDVSIDGQTVVANMDEMLMNYLPEGETQTPDALQSVILSLTENTSASGVQIKVNGEEAVSVNGTPLEQPLSKPAWVNPI